jgi:TFIIF-interacting CTD phosphatase-like protein
MNLKQKALKLGATAFGRSRRKYKKYYVIYKNKKIHFGDNRYEDFTMHKDIARRRRYRARSSKIKDKQGRLTYKLKSSPNFWAFNLLW